VSEIRSGREIRLNIQVNSERFIAIYFANPRLREQLFVQIERECSDLADTFEAIEDLDWVVHERGVKLLLATLSEEPDDGEFAGVLGFLERLHQRRGELHVILLTPSGLTIERSREFITYYKTHNLLSRNWIAQFKKTSHRMVKSDMIATCVANDKHLPPSPSKYQRPHPFKSITNSSFRKTAIHHLNVKIPYIAPSSQNHATLHVSLGG